MPVKIVRNDIVKMDTDAIVNTANSEVAVGDGCDRAIYSVAGYEQLIEARSKIGVLHEGEAALTEGFSLPAKYIIHAVSPQFRDGRSGEEEKLRSCYRNSLRIAREKKLKSIAFPVIATGSFNYPLEEGMRIALDEINGFLLENDMLVYLVVFGNKATELGKKLYPGLEAYIDRNYVNDRRAEEYCDESAEMLQEPVDMPQKSAEMLRKPVNMPQKMLDDMPRNGVRAAGKGLFSFGRNRKQKKATSSEGSIGNNRESSSAEFDYDNQDCLDELDRKLKERMAHMSDSFSTYLQYLIKSKGMENSEVYNRAVVNKKVFSKIKNNVDYHPKKMTVLCLCVGARLSLDESKDLLARAGYALSPCDKQDIIFSYFIENGIYDMIELDIQLEEHGLDPIIA